MQRVLSEGKVALPDVEAYAVASGPGSFTGVRVGLTTVKGLAEVYGRGIAAVSRLEAIGSEAGGAGEWIASVVDASRGEIYAGLYRRENGRVCLEGEECVLRAEEFVEVVAGAIPGGGVLWVSPDAGLISGAAWWVARERAGDRLQAVRAVFAPRIGRIGYQRAREGKLVDALGLDANYIRRSDAERFWKGGGAP